MSPIAARNDAATITLTPGTVISRRICGERSAVARDQPVDRGDLGVEERDLAQTALERLALLDRQLELGQPATALDAEHVADRWPADQPPDDHRVDLVLAARALPNKLRAPRQPPAHHPRLLIRDPDIVQRPGR